MFVFVNFIFIAIYTSILSLLLLDWWKAGAEPGVFFFEIVANIILGLLCGILYLILVTSYKHYNRLIYYFIPPTLCGIFGLIFIASGLKTYSMFLCFGIMISVYDKLVRYLYKEYFGRFTTTLIFIFSILTSFYAVSIL